MSATGLTRKTLLVDGNNCLVRSVFAARNKHVDLTNDEGVPTAALHIFIGLISKYVRQEQPDSMVVCWDGGRSAHRAAIYDDYKAARPDAPDHDEKDRPFAQAKEFLTLAGIHHVEHPGVEADDLIAAYWRRKSSTERVVILSADKDFLQLLDGWTEQIRPGTGVDERWTRNRVRTEMGCTPEQIPLTMALSGDASDGIPGVPRFGHKTACKVLREYDWDLDRALAECPKLEGQRAVVARNLSLVDLRSAIPDIEVPAAVPLFAPTTRISIAYQPLVQFLDRYRLAQVRSRLDSDTLWREKAA